MGELIPPQGRGEDRVVFKEGFELLNSSLFPADMVHNLHSMCPVGSIK